MKTKIILMLSLILTCNFLNAQNDKNSTDNLHRRSQLNESSVFAPWQTSYPYPFIRTGTNLENPKSEPAVSTGYYFVDSNDPADSLLRPNVIIKDTSEDKANWHRIISGPKQKLMSYWQQNPELGFGFFRNPDYASDSSDNAIAGPIPIGFKFAFNGIEYDSFYVSTNGCVAFSNCRYYYNKWGGREVRANNYGIPNCYNPMSADWFRRSRFKGDGRTDPARDDFGWISVTGGTNAGQFGGIRNPDLMPDLISEKTGAALITPFYGDGYLAQWNAKDSTATDEGKVYYYLDKDNGKLIIYFVNFRLKDTLQTPFGSFVVNAPDKMKSGDNGCVIANVQIVINKSDSSITFIYEKFSGSLKIDKYTFNAQDIFRYNSHCGVFGYARQINFNSKKAKNPFYKGTLPWYKEYFQHTYSWSKNLQSSEQSYPNSYYAIKFKQWKNTLRVVDLSFRVRKQKEGTSDFTEPIPMSKAKDFEILAGHEQIGQLQPVAILQNLTNDIQGPNGVNYQPQDLNFRVRCSIINQVTRRALYNKYVKVDSLAIARKDGENAYEKIILSKVSFDGKDYSADTMHSAYYGQNNKLKTTYKGIPPYGFVQIYFPPFEPNELFLTHIGMMKAFLMAVPIDPKMSKGFGDMWPFDDTLNIRFWVMRHIPSTESFTDDVREFHVVEGDNKQPIAIPSVFKWVNLGAEVVSGDSVSDNPQPPRGEFLCDIDELFPNNKIWSPAIKMNRPENVGIQQWGGDEIRSYPIDMFGKFGSVLTISVQRAAKRNSWDRGWSDEQLVGCEHRVVSSYWYRPVQEPDELRVEFAMTSPRWQDGTGIANIPEENWRYHLRKGGAPPERNMSAYTLYGGGGYMAGFLEKDKDSALAPPVYSNPKTGQNGLRYDFYDDGIDFEYKKLFIPIPDTIINAPKEGGRYFRMRIKEYAKNHQRNENSIPDDDDPFYVDNIRILYSTDGDGDVDVELIKVSVEWPYTMVPASQAVALPIRLTLSNNTNRQAPSFWVKTVIAKKSDFDEMYYLKDKWIYKGNPKDKDYEYMIEFFKARNQASRDSARWMLLHARIIYCRIKQMPFLRPGSNEPITMPNWNARLSPPGDYVILSLVYVPGKDLEPSNDTNYCFFTTRFGPYMSYHPIADKNNLRTANNDVEQFSGVYGQGLNLPGYKMGGVNNYKDIWAYGGTDNGFSPGEIAMEFDVFQEDTIFGYGAYFAMGNAAPDNIKYKLYDGDNKPVNLIPNSEIGTQRFYDEFLDSNLYNKIVFAKLPKPIVLPQGTYWVSINQLGESGLELGASKYRSGMRCTNVYYNNPKAADKNGSKAIYLNIEKKFRQREKYGRLLMKNFFCYRNGTGKWEKFVDTIANPAYAHLLHNGVSPVDDITETYSRSAWIPLIVPYLGNREYASTWDYLDCWAPVELSFFQGYTRNKANELIWETASEIENYGFFVERKIEDDEWKTLPGFVSGHGTSNIPHEYYFADKDVEANKTYHYRLRQVDMDGTQSCDDFSGIVTLTFLDKEGVKLEQNSPNPFSDATKIRFSLPEKTFVILDILNIYGDVISVLLSKELSAGSHEIKWDAKDGNSRQAPSGAYIYRLKAGNEVITGKMILMDN